MFSLCEIRALAHQILEALVANDLRLLLCVCSLGQAGKVLKMMYAAAESRVASFACWIRFTAFAHFRLTRMS